MITQGSNLPIYFSNIPISLDSIADVSVGIYTQKDGKELKHWGKDDLTITENGILAPISQSESMGLPVGFCYVELKFTDNSGMILPGIRVMDHVSRRDDKTKLAGEQPQTLRYVDIDCSNALTDVGAVVGASAYEVAVKNGFKGTVGEWLDSLHGKDGKDGAPGAPGEPGTPGANGNDGSDGITPHIGDNGNWFIGETDTGIKAQGADGKNGDDGADGITPYIGENGHWYIGDTDTGVTAQGKDGYTPQKGIDYFDGADGEPGADGKSAYEYAQNGGYTGTEEEFAQKLAAEYLKDVQINGMSIVENGVAEIPFGHASPISSLTKIGINNFKPYGNGGVAIGTSSKCLFTVKATHDIIDRRSASNYLDGESINNNHCRVISPAVLDYAVKAAMCDGKGAAWTADEKAAARDRMGVSALVELIDDITTEEDVSKFEYTLPEGKYDEYAEFIALLNVPATNEVGSSPYQGLYPTASNGGMSYAFQLYAKYSTTNKLILYQRLSKRTGYFQMEYRVDDNIYDFSPLVQQSYNTIFEDKHKVSKFSGIKFRVGGTNCIIPAGMNLKIYGVRA